MDLQSNIPETELDHTPYSLQTDMNLITNWSEKYRMSFNQAKCHVLHLGHNNPKASYTMYKQTETVKTPGGIKYTLKFHTLDALLLLSFCGCCHGYSHLFLEFVVLLCNLNLY